MPKSFSGLNKLEVDKKSITPNLIRHPEQIQNGQGAATNFEASPEHGQSEAGSVFNSRLAAVLNMFEMASPTRNFEHKFVTQIEAGSVFNSRLAAVLNMFEMASPTRNFEHKFDTWVEAIRTLHIEVSLV